MRKLFLYILGDPLTENNLGLTILFGLAQFSQRHNEMNSKGRDHSSRHLRSFSRTFPDTWSDNVRNEEHCWSVARGRSETDKKHCSSVFAMRLRK
jgi:hypothetical protein